VSEGVARKVSAVPGQPFQFEPGHKTYCKGFAPGAFCPRRDRHTCVCVRGFVCRVCGVCWCLIVRAGVCLCVRALTGVWVCLWAFVRVCVRVCA